MTRLSNFWRRTFLREIAIGWKFINNDIWDLILPSLVIFFTAWGFGDRPWSELPFSLFKAIIYACLFIYTFCISNQLTGIEEDRVNKPYRPLPTGYVSVQETWNRLIVYNIIYLVVGYMLGIFWFSVAWVMVSLCLNMFGWSNHWVSKNLLGMTLGNLILFNVQWKIAQSNLPISEDIQMFFILMSIWTGFALPLQDFRDMQGDKLMGRKTLPLSIGDRNARIVMFFNLLILLPVIFLFAMFTQRNLSEISSNTTAIGILTIGVIIHWVIAWRLLIYRNPREDHRTYLSFVLLFCAAVPVICII